MPCSAKRLVVSLTTLCLFAASAANAQDSEIDRAIAKHRMGTLTVHTKPGAEVTVEQLRHEFWFGAAISSGPFGGRANPEVTARYKKVFLENFNAAVTENALKWHAMEQTRGNVDYRVVDAILAWTEQHDIPLRGHNIFWGVTGRVQDWQKQLDDDELREVLKKRATTIGKRYRGRFAEYDLNNEMIHDNYYEKRLGPAITKQMAIWVHEGDPDAILYLNDYDVLTGNQLQKYVAHIETLLEQGVSLGGIGVQGHLHGDSFDAGALKRALDTLARFKLPIRVTEFNFPGQRSQHYRDRRSQLTPEEEEAKAKAIVDYYRICFAHPAVKGILMWGFWEGANWIPVSSLYRRDWTPTPAAHAYRDLVYKTWWTSWKGKADANGQCEVPAFYGTHRVAVGDTEKIVDLKSADGTGSVSF
ncbi:MAG: endo-1,4-beta-xylanase [Pirellulales bacterium]|nr:endo-1,4-beta-xylanase [Pirellulales bacterium]